ncbi:MAG: NAD-dependent DNA ligase LigA, partial [Chlamydiia bacterium]|nr:NAD-dependent DNA ligase LigA [Chlamydiia bacterium]
MTKDEYLRLCEEVWKHNRLYYVDHAPIISDEQFDRLLKQVEEIEANHPEWVTPSSPTQRVGEQLTQGFKTVKHAVPMLSLANTYSPEEVDDFLKRTHKQLHKNTVDLSAELKMDGIAVSVRFEKGIYTRAVTRGNGKEGDDITQNLRTIKALPLQLYGKSIPDVLEVRGEVFMPHAVFHALNKQKEKAGEPLWANPRNAAAGSLKLLDPKEVSRRDLSVVFYAIALPEEPPISLQHEVPSYLGALGLPTLALHALCRTRDEIWHFAEKVLQKRKSLPYDIDGIVLKVDKLSDQVKLGMTGKTPRWAVAYKFAAEQATTVIHDITVQVGRTGVLTPVAELDPVFLAGSTIARATLHNQDEIARKDIRIGDTVIIEKGGDVIPKVAEVVLDKRPAQSKVWHMPTKCPACGTPVM